MKFELTVSDKLSGWGYANKHYRPGIYCIEGDDVVNAAKSTLFGVSVRPISEDEATEIPPEGIPFSEELDSTGTMRKEDVSTHRDKLYSCRYQEIDESLASGEKCEAWPFGTERARNQHEEKGHGDVFDEEAHEPPPAPEPPLDPNQGELVQDNTTLGNDPTPPPDEPAPPVEETPTTPSPEETPAETPSAEPAIGGEGIDDEATPNPAAADTPGEPGPARSRPPSPKTRRHGK